MSIESSTILVTGGAGFIGSHIVESLVQLGARLKVYDNFSLGTYENLQHIQKHIEIIEGDILDYDLLLREMRGVDFVSHHAAQLEIFRSNKDPYDDLQTNTVGTLNVLRASRECRIQKVINASSACIYGQVNGITSENHYPRPNWAYGVSKLAAEKYCDIFNDYKDLPIVSLRYGITYGEREWFRRVLTIFLKRVLLNLPPVIFGDGKQIRDFIYVGDVVRLHNLCLESEVANGKVYNVGTGEGTTIEQLAQEVVNVSGKKLDIIYENTPEGEFSQLVPDKKRNDAELKVMLLDVSKAKAELDWEPSTPLREGLHKELVWAQNNLKRWEKLS